MEVYLVFQSEKHGDSLVRIFNTEQEAQDFIYDNPLIHGFHYQSYTLDSYYKGGE